MSTANQFQNPVRGSEYCPSYEFGPFVLDTIQHALLKQGKPVDITPKTYDTLLLLVQNRGRMLSKEELMTTLWPDSFVEESNLTQQVSMIRKTLGESASEPRYIVTVPGRGYRFNAEVQTCEEDGERTGSNSTPQLSAYTSDRSRNEQLPAARTNAIGRETSEHIAIVETLGMARSRRVWLFFAGLFAASLLLIFGLRWKGPTTAPLNSPYPMKLAVLPFQNFSGNASQDYFSDGLTEEMITQLGGLNGSQLSVVARTSSMAYKNTTKDVAQIGRELGVDYVLENGVRRDGDQLRITVQLVRVKDQVHVWANSYDRKLTHSISVQEEVAREVAQQIKVRLAHAETGPEPLNAVANDAYLKGRYFLNQFTEDGFRQAISYFNQAVAADPKFASAYAGLSEAYTFLVITNTISPQEGWPKVRDAAQKAVELDGTLSDGRLALAHFRMQMWDWKNAEADFKAAIALNPSSEKAHRWYAAYLSSLGRHEESIKEITQARGLDPLSSIDSAEVVREFYYSRRYQQGLEEARKAELLDPEFPRTHFWLGHVYAQMGKYSEASAEAVRAGPPDSILRMTEMAYASAKAGKTAQALALLGELHERYKRSYVPAYDLAIVHLALGENEAALQWLQKAYDEHDWALMVLAVEPRLDRLRSDPGFQMLIHKVGLQEP